MGIEIERKFLVNGTGWKKTAQGVEYRQGYLTLDPERTVRVRIAGEKGYLTVKGGSRGLTRLEFEYEIAYADAVDLLDRLCIKPLLEKKRYRVEHQGLVWEVDEFAGENSGLVVAEVELESETQEFSPPDWIGEEVSADPRYFNASLVLRPWKTWKS
jgi:CYTH domain-containing protein